MAANSKGLKDEDGEFSDWVEIYNPADTPLPLAGYHLTDDPQRLDKWTFPPVTIGSGSYLVIFASGKNRTDPARPLHTNFKLSAEGEYLGLVGPDRVSVLSAFKP